MSYLHPCDSYIDFSVIVVQVESFKTSNYSFDVLALATVNVEVPIIYPFLFDLVLDHIDSLLFV